jgi:hypothetical protein
LNGTTEQFGQIFAKFFFFLLDKPLIFITVFSLLVTALTFL